jgi:hypothetical protein
MKKIVFAALLLVFNTSFCIAGDPYQAADSSAQQAQGHFGSSGAIQQNAVNPLIGGGPLSTVDGTKQSTVQISCPASDKFLTVLIAPAATNDLSMVNIYQDADLDGNVEYSYTLPFPVSGVCANGVISCDPGTWANCNYYQWISDTNGHVSMANTGGITSLGGCYCINNSCGNNLVWINLNNILKDIGGGIVGAVQAQKPQYTISSVSIDGTTISYTGQDERRCTSGPAYQSGTTTPQTFAGTQASKVQVQQYTNYAGDMQNAASQEIVKQSSDPNSYYSLLAQTATNQNAVMQTNSCTIKRDVSVQESTTCPTGETYSSAQDICIGPPVSVSADQSSSYWFYNGAYRLYCSGSGMYLTGNSGGYSRSWTITGATCSGDANGGAESACITYLAGSGNQLLVYAVPKTPWSCDEFGCTGGCGGTPMYLGALTFSPAIVSGSTRSLSCPLDDASGLSFHDMCVWATWTSISISAATDPVIKQDNISNTIDDQCIGLENNTSCSLQNETVDGVNTYTNYQPTGLVPLPRCKTFTGFQSHQVCEDWWKKDRVYQCKKAQSLDFSDLKRRTDVVAGSATGDLNTGMTYKDAPRDANGNIISTSGSMDLSQANKLGSYACEQACKTRRPKQNTQASLSGTDNLYQNNTLSYDFLYYQCNNGVCPAGAGETILKNCQCIDDFAEAVSIMSALAAAGTDIICSSGIKQ